MQKTKIAYSVNEASAALGIGRSKLYGLIAEGKLTPSKIGSRTIILASQLNKFAESLPTMKTGGLT